MKDFVKTKANINGNIVDVEVPKKLYDKLAKEQNLQ